jgi:hypothetical protein
MRSESSPVKARSMLMVRESKCEKAFTTYVERSRVAEIFFQRDNSVKWTASIPFSPRMVGPVPSV